MKLNKILNGINFREAADIAILREWPRSLQEQPFEALQAKREYFDGAIIFCDSYYLFKLFEEIKDHENKYILISHLRDLAVTKSIFELKPKCIKKWFAQNADHQHPDIIPIPIGIENHVGTWKGTLIDLAFWENYSLDDTYAKENPLYINFGGAGSEYLSHHSRESWLSCLSNQGFPATDRLPSVDNLNEVKRHYACASPRGNGIDCHRTWEALYFNCVPIVPKHPMYDSFDAPIFQVEDERLIDKEFISLLVSKYNNGEIQFNKKILNMDYWISKILKEREKL